MAQSKQGIFSSRLHYKVSENFVLLEYAQGFSKTVTVLHLKHYTPKVHAIKQCDSNSHPHHICVVEMIKEPIEKFTNHTADFDDAMLSFKMRKLWNLELCLTSNQDFIMSI